MYRMKQFAAMTGMTQSKIRFYEKHGLVLSDRMENGYRVFTPEDAFRSNAFRVLLQYGFSISEAIEMLDAKQDTAEFRESLQEQRQKLEHERILLDYRQRRIESVLDVLETDGKVDFKLVHIPDQLYVNASHGRDFTVSMENEKVLAEYYDLLSITSCARIITRENLLDSSPSVDPDYINTVSVGEEHFLSPLCPRARQAPAPRPVPAIPPHGHPRGVYSEGDVRRTVRAPRRPWPDHLRGHPHHADVPQPRRRGQRHRGSLRAC